jgi:cytochrome c peroxidase
VHELGARVPSLRRLSKKRPYFTNGAAPDLASVVQRARFRGSEFFHENAPDDASALTPSDQTALVEFLRLL